MREKNESMHLEIALNILYIQLWTDANSLISVWHGEGRYYFVDIAK